MRFSLGPKRTICGLFLQVIFLAFLVFGSLETGLRPWEYAKDEISFSEEPSFEISSFRNSAGSENSQVFGIKPLNISGSALVTLFSYSRFLQEHVDISPEINRFLCHVFYVFVSSKAP